MLRLIRFVVYFESILTINLLFSYRNNDISGIHSMGFGAMLPLENFEENVQFGAL